jgi:hypothetical protein
LDQDDVHSLSVWAPPEVAPVPLLDVPGPAAKARVVVEPADLAGADGGGLGSCVERDHHDLDGEDLFRSIQEFPQDQRDGPQAPLDALARPIIAARATGSDTRVPAKPCAVGGEEAIRQSRRSTARRTVRNRHLGEWRNTANVA